MLKIKRTGAADYGRFIKMLVCATPGSGKTKFGATARNPLIVDCESGLMTIAEQDIPYATVETSLENDQLLLHLSQDDKTQEEMLGFLPETIVIDTVDELQKIYERERLKATNQDHMTMKDWGWLKDRMIEDVILPYRNLDKNVIFLCHVKEDRDDEEGPVRVKPGLKGGIADDIAQYFDIAATITVEEYMDVENDTAVKKVRHVMQVQMDNKHDWLKDRSAKLPPRFVLDGEKDFERIHKSVFKNMPALEEVKTEEIVIETPEGPADDLPDKIVRQPEKPADPTSDSDNDSDNEGESK